jgi:hypothetical protein
MLSNLTTLVLDQAADRSTFTDRTPPLKSSYMPLFFLIGFTLPSIFKLRVSLSNDALG